MTWRTPALSPRFPCCKSKQWGQLFNSKHACHPIWYLCSQIPHRDHPLVSNPVLDYLECQAPATEAYWLASLMCQQYVHWTLPTTSIRNWGSQTKHPSATLVALPHGTHQQSTVEHSQKPNAQQQGTCQLTSAGCFLTPPTILWSMKPR